LPEILNHVQPWYLTTAAVAEQLYDALIVWKAQGALDVTATSLNFFRQFAPSVTAGSYSSSTATFTTLTNGVKNFADGFLAINAKFTVCWRSLPVCRVRSLTRFW
jgi:glucoamylase